MPTPAKRSNNRTQELLDSAAEHFSKHGYRASTMRKIAVSCGMLPGSIYYHYPSKEALLLAVYEEGVRQLVAGIQEQMENPKPPLQRLKDVMAQHIAMITAPSAYASVLIRVMPDAAPEISDQLIELRDQYETLLKNLVDDLPVSQSVNKSLMRLVLIGAANHVHYWYQPGTMSTDEIASQIVGMIFGTENDPT